jgi:23S rRNA pseudouridine955/2504/2580 synthase
MYINDEFFARPDGSASLVPPRAPDPDIVYEDGNILLVNKRAGLLSHPGAPTPGADGGGAPADTLIARVRSYLYRAGQWRPDEESSFTPALCNRLDRNTSGLVIAAKNAEAMRIINEKISGREIDKLYLAVVHGEPKPPSGALSGYIFKDSVKNRVFVTRSGTRGARAAVTEYRTLARSGALSLVECKLVTGRTHQIRAQFAHAGYPLLGDGKYGRGTLDAPYGERRQALCSYKIVFSFKTHAGSLNYLRGREFALGGKDFAREYLGRYAAAEYERKPAPQ